MKIVQICPYDMSRPGGVQSHVRDLSAWLRRQGHEVVIVAPKSRQSKSDPALLEVGHAWKIGFHGSSFEISLVGLSELIRLRKEIKKAGAEVVHLHTPWTPLLAFQVWRALGLPTVATFHATFPEKESRRISSRVLLWVAKYFIARIYSTVVPSAAPLAALKTIPEQHDIQVLPPTIDLSDWQQIGRARPKPEGNTLTCFYLGRLEPRKGIATLLSAWERVSTHLPNARLTIAGAGDLAPLVKRAAAEAGASIDYVGAPSHEAALALMAKADLFLAPAEYGESFGLVLLEAMASGAVPVAAENAGYATVLTGQGRGLLVPPGDTVALADRIVGLAQDREIQQRLREWGYARAESFDISRFGPEYEKLFCKALAKQQNMSRNKVPRT